MCQRALVWIRWAGDVHDDVVECFGDERGEVGEEEGDGEEDRGDEEIVGEGVVQRGRCHCRLGVQWSPFGRWDGHSGRDVGVGECS